MATFVIIDVETNGLDPLTCELTAIGTRVNGKNKIFARDDNIGEAEILGNFWSWLQKIPRPILVGFNLDSFDWQWLKIRSLHYGLVIRNFTKYEDRKDLRMILNPNTYTKGTKLGDYCACFGIADGDDLSGSEMPKLWERRDYDAIRRHLEHDLEKTEALLKLLCDCGVL